jgi:hypothetical protein
MAEPKIVSADAASRDVAISRSVVLHYHLFKNAGTSVDRILKRNFAAAWVTREFNPGPQGNARDVAAWISESTDAIAFSSHTATGPLPTVAGVAIVSILMLRDPIARIRSAYQFERQQDADTFGANVAKQTDLEGYVRARLAVAGDRQCRNFQTARLASFDPGGGSELDRATRALGMITVVGLVDRFDQAMARLADALRPSHPAFRWQSVAANRSEPTAEPSPVLLDLLIEHNADDIELVARARQRLLP